LKGNKKMAKTDIVVKLVGNDGNGMAIIARVRRALVDGGHHELAKTFVNEAMDGDYDHLLRTCMDYVEVE